MSDPDQYHPMARLCFERDPKTGSECVRHEDHVHFAGLAKLHDWELFERIQDLDAQLQAATAQYQREGHLDSHTGDPR